jgi:hypothetical protein
VLDRPVFFGLDANACLAESPTLRQDERRMSSEWVGSQSFRVCEADPRWGDSISLIIRDNFDVTIGPLYTRIEVSQHPQTRPRHTQRHYM